MLVQALVLLVAAACYTDACGCHGCYYEDAGSCARCCSFFIRKRARTYSLDDLVNKVPTIDDDSYAFPAEMQQQQEPERGQLFKRDSCGCDMGCFYSTPNECVRCCSLGLRRDTDAVGQRQAEQSLAQVLQALVNVAHQPAQ